MYYYRLRWGGVSKKSNFSLDVWPLPPTPLIGPTIIKIIFFAASLRLKLRLHVNIFFKSVSNKLIYINQILNKVRISLIIIITNLSLNNVLKKVLYHIRSNSEFFLGSGSATLIKNYSMYFQEDFLII